MSALSDFLLARIAEDEQQAVRSWPFSNAKIAAECEAKRRIVDLHALVRTMGHQCVAIDGPTQHHMTDACATLRLLALPYADHPDYREEWRP